MTITEFLLARIAEDETAARLVTSVQFASDRLEPLLPALETDAFGPERVLAECEAKRRIVVRFLDIEAQDAAATHTGLIELVDMAREPLFDLAAVYSDHPDYRKEWRP